jgi:hypothetical protein
MLDHAVRNKLQGIYASLNKSTLKSNGSRGTIVDLFAAASQIARCRNNF